MQEKRELKLSYRPTDRKECEKLIDSFFKQGVNLGEVLHDCLSVGDTRMLESVLKRGIDPNMYDSQNFTPLEKVISIGNESQEAIELLLKFGANPNFVKDSSHFSPLDLATGSKKGVPVQMEVVKALIAHGATHGGVRSHGLSPEQKKEADEERQQFLQNGKEVWSVIKESLEPNDKLTVEKFYEVVMKLSQGKVLVSSEIYNTLQNTYFNMDPSIRKMVDQNLAEISEKINTTSKFMGIIDLFKSLGGYRYHEPSSVKEVHYLFINTLCKFDAFQDNCNNLNTAVVGENECNEDHYSWPYSGGGAW
jgi:hypothetical protein